MATARLVITHSDFDKARDLYNHNWLFLGEQDKGRAVKAKCRCKLCRKDYWVFWRWIKSGRSTRCASCAKKHPDLAGFNASLKEKGIAWHVTAECRTAHKKDGTSEQAREYLCICGFCQTSHWVRWRPLQRGLSRCCRGCSMRNKIQSYYQKRPLEDQILWKKWNVLNWRRKGKSAWPEYIEFKEWALQNGYVDGLYLRRKKLNRPHGPLNTYFSDQPPPNYKAERSLRVAASIDRPIELQDDLLDSSTTGRVGRNTNDFLTG